MHKHSMNSLDSDFVEQGNTVLIRGPALGKVYGYIIIDTIEKIIKNKVLKLKVSQIGPKSSGKWRFKFCYEECRCELSVDVFGEHAISWKLTCPHRKVFEGKEKLPGDGKLIIKSIAMFLGKTDDDCSNVLSSV